MALETYPDDLLPLPLVSGYEIRPVPTFRRTELANGRSRQRRLYENVPVMVPVQFLMDLEEFQYFEGWFRHAIADGAAWFNCKVRVGTGLKHQVVRFAQMYSAALVGNRLWRVEAQLEIRERDTLDKDLIIHFPQAARYASIIDRALNREWPRA